MSLMGQLLPSKSAQGVDLDGPKVLLRKNWTVGSFQFCERVKGTKRTRATARVVVLPGAIFSTTVSC